MFQVLFYFFFFSYHFLQLDWSGVSVNFIYTNFDHFHLHHRSWQAMTQISLGIISARSDSSMVHAALSSCCLVFAKWTDIFWFDCVIARTYLILCYVRLLCDFFLSCCNTMHLFFLKNFYCCTNILFNENLFYSQRAHNVKPILIQRWYNVWMSNQR